MTTLYDGYTAPAFAQMCEVVDGVAVEAQANNVVSVRAVAYGGSITLRPLWFSAYTGAQVQYRVRHRYNYASGLLVDDTGAEVWTDYPAWSDPSGATANAACQCGWQVESGRYATGISVTFSYDLSQYDLHEIEVRVRVYSSSADRCSEWCYGTTRVAFVPRLTSYTATTKADGWTYVEFASNWPRRASMRLFTFQDLREAGGTEIRSRWYDGSLKAEGEAFAIPAKARVRNATGIVGDFWVDRALMSSDDLGNSSIEAGCDLIAYSGGGYLIEPGAHTDPQDVPDPVLSVVSATGESAVIGVTCACDHVLAHVEYADADGNEYTADMEPGGSSPNWTVTLDAPPFGVAISVKVACCNASGGYKLATQSATIAGTSHCMLDGGGDHVELAYEGEYQAQTELSGESVQCAGRKLPVSRHGLGVTRSLTVKGTIAFPSVFPWGDMELSALSVLDNPHDWIFRNPKGVRKAVRVTSWSVDQGTEQLGRLAEVTIGMEEVG